MSMRTRLGPTYVISAGNMSANITSTPSILQSITGFSYEVSWVGTSPVGTISVQVSNSYSLGPDGQVLNAGNWSTLSFQSGGSTVTSIPVSGNTGFNFIDINDTNAYACRLVFTFTSGTGTMNAIINGKVS